ncbi:GNAT family N-acetyltransferase [Marinobacterium sediminicola]|uniref:Acetyltransferase (GNAT) domain-containing protein n=1 Tax=Marinobacterium sediminicola TaxID=518898 RepID=A0ABY1RZ22_9GAMM|nr:GNAT family N-acetyltransferase [Marinobacterium sediminicola]ULG68043.1 GNAT family N-acetyltransferase [Marinobacterium sediminicola]SMR73447.1 Acetyltransferase (GNAT) domain-containing protein [Marinobacterium sediminicola]
MSVSIDKANIDNLTSLWRLMGATQITDGLQQSIGWPRRCWLDWDNRNDSVQFSLVDRVPEGYLCPIWAAGVETAELEEGLLAAGFEMGLQQRAMVLPLLGAERIANTGRLQLSTPGNADEAAAWSELCGRAFGYQIDAEIIDRVRQQPDVEVLWGVRDGVPVATAIVYHTGSILGVHQVGVSPEQQGRGVARELMQMLVARAQARKARYLCLQASAAGEPLYLRMGFQPQFTIRSYRRA